MRHPLVLSLLGLVLFAARVDAIVYTVEPDDFANGAALTTVSPHVTLSTLDQFDQVVPLFTVTAETDPFGFAPSGTKVFAHAGVGFWIDTRKLRMDFTQPVSSLSLGFAGGTNFDTDFGLLNVYNTSGTLLDSFLSGGMAPGQKTTLGITRPTNDIAYAVAYSVPGDGPFGPFGRLDALTFDTSVPEPGAVASLVVLPLVLSTRARSRHLARRTTRRIDR